MKKALLIASLALTTLLSSVSSHATVSVVTNGGLITGVNNLNVGGTLYNLTFGDTFTTPTVNKTTARSIMNELGSLLSGGGALSTSSFGLVNTTTLGCDGGYIARTTCNMYLPYMNTAFNGAYSVQNTKRVEAFNTVNNHTNRPMGFVSNSVANGFRYTGVGASLAVITSPVPEPSTYMMMGLGLFGIVAMRKRQKNIMSL